MPRRRILAQREEVASTSWIVREESVESPPAPPKFGKQHQSPRRQPGVTPADPPGNLSRKLNKPAECKQVRMRLKVA